MFTPASIGPRIEESTTAKGLVSSFIFKPEAQSLILTFSKSGALFTAFTASRAFSMSTCSREELLFISEEFVGSK